MKSEEKKFELVKFSSDGVELEVNVDPKEETIWLSQSQMVELFCTTKQNISLHINNIFKEKELDRDSVVKEYLTTANDGKSYATKYYNLDVVISVGYRVKSNRGVIFRRWAINVLKEYLLKGYVINEDRVTVSNENYIQLRNEVSSINNRLLKIEDIVFSDNYKLDQTFFNDTVYDCYTLIQSIFESAIDRIVIIDNYIDRTVLDRLVVKKKGVKVIIYTNTIYSKVIDSDIVSFNKEYGLLSIINTDKVHDRYIIIDYDKLYHLGASIKDLGKKIFTIIESDSSTIDELLRRIK